MATPAQIAANRRNALKSTGPKTRQGKRASSRNAVMHGVYAEISEAELKTTVEAIEAELVAIGLDPSSDINRARAARLAVAEVRLARARALARGDNDLRLQREFDLICDRLFEDEFYDMQLSDSERDQGYKHLERIAHYGPKWAAQAYRRARKALSSAEAAHERALRDFLG